MTNTRIERRVNVLTSKEQSEILWAFIIDFRTLTQSVSDSGEMSRKQVDELMSLNAAVRNISTHAGEKFDTKIYQSFIRLGKLIEEFLRTNTPQFMAFA